ncbi:MAG: DUF711 family protein [Ignisphaera sp.]
MPLTRALAIHIPHDYYAIEYLDKIVNILDRIKKCLKTCSVEPWTFRLIFPSITNSNYKGVEKYLDELFSVIDRDILVSMSIEEMTFDINQLINIMHNHKKFYTAIRCSNDECIDKVVTAIYDNSSKNIDINVYTRIALVFGSWIETPYFPATCNVSNTLGLSAALRYVDLVDRALIGGSPYELYNFIQYIQDKMECISKYSSIPFLGIDLSLSPWREESIASLLEKLIGNKIGSPGTINAIYSLNKLIDGIIKKLRIRSIGFNEVMLPVAEDDILNKRVEEGFIRLRDLINYSIVCVAGLDMVAIPKLLVDIRRTAIDMLTVHKIKKRSVAMRIIPVDQEPGTSIKLENFGTTYVIFP